MKKLGEEKKEEKLRERGRYGVQKEERGELERRGGDREGGKMRCRGRG